jgi:hypothetical protein
MSIEGRIAVDVNFADSATSGGVQSLKKIALTGTTPYTTGKVAIVTGTAGTAGVEVLAVPTTYKDAGGNAVSIAAVKAFAFSATGAPCRCAQDYAVVESSNGFACVSLANGADDGFFVSTTAGTALYTLVLYGT